MGDDAYRSTSPARFAADRAGAGVTRVLPLTEPEDARAAGGISESEIRALVDTFYSAVREDDMLGPVFAHQVKDWSLHLPKMYDFWSTVVRRTGRYAGRPFEAHSAIPGLTPAHFDRWLRLWAEAVSRLFPPPHDAERRVFVTAAQRMAASMLNRLQEGS